MFSKTSSLHKITFTCNQTWYPQILQPPVLIGNVSNLPHLPPGLLKSEGDLQTGWMLRKIIEGGNYKMIHKITNITYSYKLHNDPQNHQHNILLMFTNIIHTFLPKILHVLQFLNQNKVDKLKCNIDRKISNTASCVKFVTVLFSYSKEGAVKKVITLSEHILRK